MTTATDQDIKDLVKEKYGAIANQSREQNAASCCGVDGCGTVDYTVFAEDYTKLKGYVADADLGLGCGLPTEFAQIKEGDMVVDLGSGAGNDAFVARAIVGERGKVIGIDMTEAMISKARENAEKLGFNNVEFRLGEIEHMPITADRADVVVSNCVLNLVPNKAAAFAEMYRILKPGGHFSVSDVVVRGTLPDAVRHDAELYAGCVAGAIDIEEYLSLLRSAGFEDVTVQRERTVTLPPNIDTKDAALLSVTVYGKKPSAAACCAPGCC
jgi:SAM-dependent methyltransferase